MQRERLWLIDGLRGLWVISMVLYHMVYDLRFVFGQALPWYDPWWGYLWQQSICWGFILLAGFSWTLGSRQLRRGLLLLACGTLVSAVTILAMPAEAIRYGILTFHGAAVLLMIPLHRLLRRAPPGVGAAVSLGLFLICKPVNSGWLGFADWGVWRLPAALYAHDGLAFLGFVGPNFYSADYFSLLPWFLLFCCGYFLGMLLRQRRAPALLCRRLPGFEWVGRHALLVYVLHQPVLMAVLWLIFR